ncbi:DsrE family protein [Alicyclobacillus tolerans]|uniref:DsrE family protein n=1 Tax=Alicyclobacillus tolerans TaxID=90970 RepID=UPI001F42AF8B|nr:DsrE family protein [Alicyclobacillus tolerans]MCF8563619.1 DsrE family protein [Alicyclobacillus tolerans]
MNQKFVIFVHAKEDEGAKAAHALLYAKELDEAGIEVKIVFDGAGVKSLAALSTNTDRPSHQLYLQLKDKGIIAGVCEFCSTAMGVQEQVLATGIVAMNEINGHPSIAKFVQEGYTPIVM